MLLYHGSNIEVVKPKILKTARTLDFGVGFYLTSHFKQANKWAQIQTKRRKEGIAKVSSFEFNLEQARLELAILTFAKPDELWLDFVAANRSNTNNSINYDIVIGPVANDNTMPVINNYMDGEITKEVAIQLLLPGKLENQYTFLTGKSLKYIHYQGVKSHE